MKSKRTVMEISDRAKGEGLQRTEQREPSSLLEWPSRNGRRRSQIPLFNAAGLQIRPNGATLNATMATLNATMATPNATTTTLYVAATA